MIKAIDFQQVERFPYIFRRPFFARMCDAQQTSIPCCGEDPREFSGWVSYFRGIEPHANDSIELRFGRPESFECVRFIQMAKKTEDQSGGQTVSRLGLSHCCQQPVRNDRSEEHTSELQSLMSSSYAVFYL